ncbi:MAG: hypothetical protein KF902_14215 [Phycisphaeraceae bacterium]|nr:hypothetical protein [Phycisphaeraceae bacterium]
MNAVDTNVLVYSCDTDEQVKGPVAVALLDRLSADATPCVLLWQVLCEFTAFIARARQRGSTASDTDAFDYVRAIRERFSLVVPGTRVSELAIDTICVSVSQSGMRCCWQHASTPG